MKFLPEFPPVLVENYVMRNVNILVLLIDSRVIITVQEVVTHLYSKSLYNNGSLLLGLTLGLFTDLTWGFRPGLD